MRARRRIQEQAPSLSTPSLLALSPAALVSEVFAQGGRVQHAPEAWDKGEVRGL